MNQLILNSDLIVLSPEPGINNPSQITNNEFNQINISYIYEDILYIREKTNRISSISQTGTEYSYILPLKQIQLPLERSVINIKYIPQQLTGDLYLK